MSQPAGKKDTVRFTVSLDSQCHAKLLRAAESSDLPLSWAVRRAGAELAERQDSSQQAGLPFPQPGPKGTV